MAKRRTLPRSSSSAPAFGRKLLVFVTGGGGGRFGGLGLLAAWFPARKPRSKHSHTNNGRLHIVGGTHRQHSRHMQYLRCVQMTARSDLLLVKRCCACQAPRSCHLSVRRQAAGLTVEGAGGVRRRRLLPDDGRQKLLRPLLRRLVLLVLLAILRLTRPLWVSVCFDTEKTFVASKQR